MPLTVPTAAEVAHVPWYARQKIRAAAIAALREWIGDEAEPEQAAPVVDFGRSVRDEARLLAMTTPPDPDASIHRQALADVIEGRSE